MSMSDVADIEPGAILQFVCESLGELRGVAKQAAVRRGARAVLAEGVSATARASQRVNAVTGTPAVVLCVAQPADQGSLTRKALAFVTRESQSFGFDAAGAAAQFTPDPAVNKTTGGSAAVHLQQVHEGVPVFQMSRTVRFDKDERIIDAVGDNAAIESDFKVAPRVDAASAVLAAAQHIASTAEEQREDEFGQQHAAPTVNVSGFVPALVSSVALPTRPAVFDKGPFASPIQASLVVFQQPEQSRLAWQVLLTLPDYADQYLVLVAADVQANQANSREILYSRSLMHHAQARGTVFEFTPGIAQRRAIDFPQPIAEYDPVTPLVQLQNFPRDWVQVNQTVGNSARAMLNNGSTSLAGVLNGNVVDFNPVPDFGDDHKLLNIFYFCNFMHDCLFMLGFDEFANFQQMNLGQGGAGGDAVLARAHSGVVFGTANMSTPPDGQPPVMNMGLVASTGRHTAFDADVVFHEYTHGLTQRLVGGPLDFDSLGKLQSGGMGEGWSDYFALTIQNARRRAEKVVVGDWVVNNPAGIRSAPYDDNFPSGYGDLRNFPEVHDIGEVWCATLMMMTRRIRAAVGEKEGYLLSWRIVVDGLKLLSADPTFLQARDGILRALDDALTAGTITAEVHRAARKAAWEAFAHFGMGVNAQSDDADDVDNIIADHSLPVPL